MVRKFVCWLLLVVSSIVFAEKVHATEPTEPLDPAYQGIHGMVVFNHASALYVSNLPSYRKPHNVQLIYKLEAKDPALVFLTRDADLVTIKPEPFNIQRLMRGESVTVKADVYIGHFDRGGSLTYEQVELTFSEQKYLRMLEDLGEPNNLQKYDEVELSHSVRALVHQIQGAPSYDHIILLFQNIGCITDVNAKSTVPAENVLIQRLSFCGSMKPVYYETEAFSEGLASHMKSTLKN
ncbi:hypothetical protein [Aliiglaciecola lipolytica]|uniref:Uncharacterized protein n=1 Tax=Aliiglaciecola lipolytica E3 TaxID=1127673 RepID=K6XVT5_9ALTE|nr:hypothetical protein [Aliiglaciecola lipolytica]GAC15766.1 hypothetical protein GLIP_3145 [Aliiglaciecola lipolytica E3]